jgi:hypothetical protein
MSEGPQTPALQLSLRHSSSKLHGAPFDWYAAQVVRAPAASVSQ